MPKNAFGVWEERKDSFINPGIQVNGLCIFCSLFILSFILMVRSSLRVFYHDWAKRGLGFRQQHKRYRCQVDLWTVWFERWKECIAHWSGMYCPLEATRRSSHFCESAKLLSNQLHTPKLSWQDWRKFCNLIQIMHKLVLLWLLSFIFATKITMHYKTFTPSSYFSHLNKIRFSSQRLMQFFTSLSFTQEHKTFSILTFLLKKSYKRNCSHQWS